MKTIKIYRHFYDNDKNIDGTEKQNEYLGEFELEEEEYNRLGYNFEFVGTRKEDGKKYRVSGIEVSGLADPYNSGTKCFIEGLN